MRILNHPRHNIIRVVTITLLLVLALPGAALAQGSMDLVIHHVKVEPFEGQMSYDVMAFFSVLDQEGQPVSGLKVEDFTVSEDGNPVEIGSLSTAMGDPISLVLVVDTSGSMSLPMEAARKAMHTFINGLSAADQVAIVSFNEEATVRQGFTANHNDVRQQIDGLAAVPGAGTCIFDAAYEAVELATTTPAGRRAVVLLTDGVDETPDGDPCSSHTKEEVAALAADENAPVPVFAVGLGDRDDVDEEGLGFITKRSRASYMHSPTPADLEDLYINLLELLKSEYVIRYTSDSIPGVHTLAVGMGEGGAQDMRKFSLPVLPTMVHLTYPAEGVQVSGEVILSAAVVTQGDVITRVVFTLNGQSIGEVFKPPYELEWDAASIETGEAVIGAVAFGEEGAELARDEAAVEITFAPYEEPDIETEYTEGEEVATEDNVETVETDAEEVSEDSFFSGSTLYILLGVGLVVLALIIGVIVFLLRRKKQAVEEPEDVFVPLAGGPRVDGTFEELPVYTPGTGARTALPGEAGVFEILKSKDASMQGQKYSLKHSEFTIGSSPEHDMVFGPGTGVSRRHALIRVAGGQAALEELRSPEGKRPSYGTYVDGVRVTETSEPVTLKEGNIIRLGNLNEMRFEQKSFAPSGQGTYEDLPVYKPDDDGPPTQKRNRQTSEMDQAQQTGRETTEVEKPE